MRWYFRKNCIGGNFWFAFTGHMTDTESHDMAQAAWTEGDRDIYIHMFIGIFKNDHVTSLETAEKCSCTSETPSRLDGEGIPRAVANIVLKILEKSQTEGCNGGK